MRHYLKHILALVCVLTLLSPITARNLVILHTNDTHSQIDPDKTGAGGVLLRKAIIDSVRAAEDNVILVDAGDIVQGSLYFKFFKGEVEYPLMDLMGYDYMILGNHDFDNGIDSLAKHLRHLKTTKLSSNYDMSGTPLNGMFRDYDIRVVDGKRIGFFGINVDPDRLIADQNYRGLKFNPIIAEANRVADLLKKKEHCDLVVCISHIGYTNNDKRDVTDPELAHASQNIDIIIGGHSHTKISPDNPEQYLVKNSRGKDVLIVQNGKNGLNLGYIDINLDKLGSAKAYKYRWIPVADRFDTMFYDAKIKQFLAPYSHYVDSVNHVPVGWSLVDMPTNSALIGNFTADFGRQYGQWKTDSLIRTGHTDLAPRVDLAIMNLGGIRMPFERDTIFEGQVLNAYPFSNHAVLLQLKGSDLDSALQVCANKKNFEAVSSEVRVVLGDSITPTRVYIDGQPIDPERIYTVCTIDYLAWGKDGMSALANGKIVWRDPEELAAPILAHIRSLARAGIAVNPDPNPRFTPIQRNIDFIP